MPVPLELVDAPRAPERGESPVTPERFAVLQAMLADVLAACGERKDAFIDAAELAARFKLNDEELEDHLQLLNLVNFGGGCYAVYAERVEDGRTIHVEKELYGDEFRRPARLSPLEAKSLLLALDLVGPLVAADAGTALDDVRAKLEAAFGRYDMRGAPTPQPTPLDEDVLSVLSAAVRSREVVEIEYLGAPGRRRSRARRRAALPARRARRLVLRHLGSHARRRAHVPRRPHPRGQGARRDVRAPRERDGARRRRARRPRRHGVGVVLGRRRALGARGPARHRAAWPTAPRSRRCRTAPSAGSAPSSAATSARPCCSSPSRCARRSPRAHASSPRSCARTPPPARSERRRRRAG